MTQPRVAPLRALAESDEPSQAIERLLRAVRRHLGMDIARVTQFEGDRCVVRWMDAGPRWDLARPGESRPRDRSPCAQVASGDLPGLLADAGRHPAGPVFEEAYGTPIGTHLGTAVPLPDGRVFGAFCCAGIDPDGDLHERDLGYLELLAELVGELVERYESQQAASGAVETRIVQSIEAGEPTLVYQPIFHLASRRVVGLEALSRFDSHPEIETAQWFTDAKLVGMSERLETTVIHQARAALPTLPDNCFVAINVSGSTVLADSFAAAFDGAECRRIVVEITEHDSIQCYDDVAMALQPLLDEGSRLAVDDAGAGYSTLTHVLHLSPDIIKLDPALTRNVDIDVARQALTSALVTFASRIGGELIAEGIETEAELRTLQVLGVEYGQGFRLARPAPLDEVLARYLDRLG